MAVAHWMFTGWLILLAIIDARTGKLPNRLVLPAMAAALVIGVLIPIAGMSAIVAALPYLVGFRLRAVGGGDVKLAFVLGAAVANPVLSLLMVLAAQLLWLIGLMVMRALREARPHGPALAVAGAVALCLA